MALKHICRCPYAGALTLRLGDGVRRCPKAEIQDRLGRICEEAVRWAEASLRLFVTLHPPAANGLQL